MKKILFVLSVIILLSSCFPLIMTTTTADLEKRVFLLKIGMSRNEALGIMGRNYQIESISQVPEGQLDVLRFRSSIYASSYLLYFLNDRLSEFHRVEHPQVVTQPVNDGLDTKIILGAYMDEKGESSIKKDNILGCYIIEDREGGDKTIKKDIFRDYIIEDKKGNKKTIKKDIFGDYVIEDR